MSEKYYTDYRSVSFENRDYIPSVSGIYFLEADGKVMYIGMAMNLYNRLIGKNHNKYGYLSIYKNIRIYFMCLPQMTRKEICKIESEYIDQYNPVLNDEYDESRENIVKNPIKKYKYNWIYIILLTIAFLYLVSSWVYLFFTDVNRFLITIVITGLPSIFLYSNLIDIIKKENNSE